MANKWVYMFSEGDMTMRNLLGGKGANLAEMSSIGLPVPQGFTITTEACTQYYEDGRKIIDEIMAQAMEGVKKMEEINGKKFGDLKNPLLVSVRSGARASMPGMMDTILNLGLNDEVVAAMIAGNPDPKFERFVYDSYRRFIQMFSDVVMEVGKKYEDLILIVVHMGGGVSVGALTGGQVVDVFNALDGDGAFSPERAGGVPNGELVRLCYSGKYTEKEMIKQLVGKAGFNAYCGSNDARDIEAMAKNGDKHAQLVFDAFLYQVSKDIGAQAAVLSGKVDQIILTGGIAYGKYATEEITKRVQFIAPVTVYGGEDELLALAQGALRVLNGEEEAKVY